MLGKILLTIDALGLIFGAPIADYNHTHIFNPRWPPHAKFHDAQTISISVMLGIATLYYTWRPSLLTAYSTTQRAGDSLATAAFTGAVYWAGGLLAALFPNVSGIDPEFGPPGFPQFPIFTAFGCTGIAGWLYEKWAA
ncbi:hypothetical protein B0H63DRAFT_392008 [Podospora didyma]|uniref:Uncharacterized protein n=1 Tax=Podospora didyma TaxID=330526 RepID=A0AAE0NRJ9_9PEZI|nr:hypothetical protein B0H63DRAFT_392008 [Podospora didyma]